MRRERGCRKNESNTFSPCSKSDTNQVSTLAGDPAMDAGGNSTKGENGNRN